MAFGSVLITGSGYSLTGNGILLGGVTSQGSGNSLGLGLKLSANGGLANTAAGAFTVSGAVDLNGFNLGVSTANSSGTTQFNGAISGSGNVSSGGNGTTVLGVANSYGGTTTLTGGTLVVRDSQGLGSASGRGRDRHGGEWRRRAATGERPRHRQRAAGRQQRIPWRSLGVSSWAGPVSTGSLAPWRSSRASRCSSATPSAAAR